jgi:hypothetical protein
LSAQLQEVVGVSAIEPNHADELYRKASETYRQKSILDKSRNRQKVIFTGGPVGLAFFADIHLGDSGVDVDAALADAKLVLDTPGMYVGGVVGDLVNNFIIGKLLRLSIQSSVAVPDEWEMAQAYLELLGPKLISVVGGNHEAWTLALSGVDRLGTMIPRSKYTVLYDRHQIDYSLVVDGVEFPGRLRHKWRLRSMYNASHGIEQAARFGGGFRWGIGAHYHEGGVVRSFIVGEKNYLAGVCGTYKRFDEFSRQIGYVTHGPKIGIGILFDPVTNSMTGFDDLRIMSMVLNSLNGKK